MIYDLPLKQPFGRFKRIRVDDNIKIKETLEGIPDFEQRLIYFNDHVCSLSIYGENEEVYFEWGNPDQRIVLYCGCENCKSKADFNSEYEKVFLRLRYNEIVRINDCLKLANSYKEKLSILFDTKGYFPDANPTVYPARNYEDSENKKDAYPVNDLRPANNSEIVIYNDFVRMAFDNEYRTESGFSENYNCFRFQDEKNRFIQALEKAIDPHNLALYCKNAIEKHFNYPECLDLNKSENEHVKDIDLQLHKMGNLGYHLFAKMLLGVEIDLNKNILDGYELLRFTHISEIVKFYKYLLEKLSPLNKLILGNQDILLNSLSNNNIHYEKYLSSFDTRLETAIDYVSKNDFIKGEIDRIENVYLRPIDFEVKGDFKISASFDVSKYMKLAYTLLKSGQNSNLNKIIKNAKNEYISYKLINTYNYKESENLEEIENVKSSIMEALQRGVALLMYEKYLNGLINTAELTNQGINLPKKQLTAFQFEDLFYIPENAEMCLNILRQLQPPVIDAKCNYIGKSKGVFPLWIKVLKNHKPEAYIKHFNDAVYKNILNAKIKGLNLSKDASEFRKIYSRLNTHKVELDIKALLSISS